jgi:hypothetical protein
VGSFKRVLSVAISVLVASSSFFIPLVFFREKIELISEPMKALEAAVMTGAISMFIAIVILLAVFIGKYLVDDE